MNLPLNIPKNPALQDLEGKKKFNSENYMPWNIYGDLKWGQHFKRTHLFHYVLKYRIVIPLFWFINKCFYKILVKKVPDDPQNIVLTIFNRSYHKSIEDWCRHFRANLEPREGDAHHEHTEEEIQKMMNCPSSNALRMHLYLMNTLYMTDTAYRPFGDILGHNFAIEMNKHFGGKKVDHAFYSSQDIFDVQYYTWWKLPGHDYRTMKKTGDAK